MARQIVLTHQGTTTAFDFKKIDRSKLYGRRVRVFLDREQNRCQRASLTTDGALLVRSGMTAQGYFATDGTWVANNKLVGLDDEGNILPAVPSTLGVPQELHTVDPSELFDHRIKTVYALESEDLNPGLIEALLGGAVMKFPFNYRVDFMTEWGFLVANDHGVFALIGNPSEFDWCELQQPEAISLDDDDDDDLDFDFF